MNGINLFGLAGVSNTTTDVLFITLFLAFSIVFFFAAVVLLSKFMYKPKSAETVEAEGAKKFSFTGILIAIIALGVIVRLIFVFAVKGYRNEYDEITAFTGNALSKGFAATFAGGTFSIYPVSAYLLTAFAGIAKIFNVTIESNLMPLFVKLPFIICDIVTAVILYIAAKKYINEYAGLIVAGLFSFFPVFIFASAVWGSLYSILCMLLVLCFYFVASKKYAATIAVYSLALLSMKEALYLFPVVAVFIIYNYVKCCIALKKSAVRKFSEVIDNEVYRSVVLIPVYIAVSIAAMYLIALPFTINVNANFFRFIYNIYLLPLAQMTTFGHNALGVFNLFGRNGSALVTTFPSVVFAVLFSVIITLLVLLIYLSRKNRANLSFLAAFIILTLSVFYMDFSELSLIPVLGVLLLSFILIKDRRILQVFGVLGFAVLFNASMVMGYAGYLNSLADSDLTGSAQYTGSVMLSSGGGLAVSIICTVIVLVAFAYAVLILLDLSMSNKRTLFKPLEEPKVFNSIKNFIK